MSKITECCPQLDRAIDDHKALYIAQLISDTSDDLIDILVLASGEYRKQPIIVKFCPFCGASKKKEPANE